MNMHNPRIHGLNIFVDVLSKFFELAFKFGDLLFDGVRYSAQRKTSTS